MKPKKTKNMINREKYKEIKKYDHRQLEEFLTAMYIEAFKDGAEATKKEGNKGVELLLDALDSGECRGIREATAKKIREFAAEKGLLPIPE